MLRVCVFVTSQVCSWLTDCRKFVRWNWIADAPVNLLHFDSTVLWVLQVTTKQGVSNVLAATQPEGPGEVFLLWLLTARRLQLFFALLAAEGSCRSFVIYTSDYVCCSQDLLNAIGQERALRRRKLQAAQIFHQSAVEDYEFDRVSLLHSIIKSWSSQSHL